MAAVKPAGPDPMIATSTCVLIRLVCSVGVVGVVGVLGIAGSTDTVDAAPLGTLYFSVRILALFAVFAAFAVFAYCFFRITERVIGTVKNNDVPCIHGTSLLYTISFRR